MVDITQNTLNISITEILNDCEKWAKTASLLVKKFYRKEYTTSFKEDASPVTIADQTIEKKLKADILKKYPNVGIFGEESGVDGTLDGDLWVIDPIDGTRYFISGHPLFGMLLAYVRNGVVKAGTICMPILNEIYTGGEDNPAKCNGEFIRVSSQRNLEDAVIYINEGEKLFTNHPTKVKTLLKTGKTRRFGYDCYSHVLLASGFVDVVIDYDLKPYDFLAVSAVVEAAGGIVSDWQGKKLTLSSDGAIISAATPELHDKILRLLTS